MSATQPARSKLKRLFRDLLFAVTAFATLLVLLLAEENWRGARAWESYKKEMEAKGERLDPARLIPPKVPDDQNFGMTPYFAQYFNFKPEFLKLPVKLLDGRLVEEGSRAITNGTNTMPAWFNRDVKHASHPLGWNYGMAADLQDWAEGILGTNADGTPARITDPVQAASIILDNMKSCEATLAELQSASQRPFSRFNLPYEDIANPQVDAAHMEFFTAAKQMYRMLSLRAQAELALGQSDQALSDIKVMFRIDDGLKAEPLLLSQLVRIGGLAILLQPVGEGLAEHRWSDAQLRVLQERLQKTDLLASALLGVYGERDLFFVSAGQQVGVAHVFPDGWERLEQINLNRMLATMFFPRIDLAARQINPAVNQACDLEVQKAAGKGGLKLFLHHAVLATMEMPAFSKVPQKTAVAQSEVDMAMIACALERYRLAEGHYPEGLNQLVPRFAAALPHDIINAQPLKYRRTGDGRFVLYSVGWNEKDDGGVVAATKPKPPRQDILQGDWVLEYPAAN